MDEHKKDQKHPEVAKSSDVGLKEEFQMLIDKYKKKLASSFKDHLPALRQKLDALEKDADGVIAQPKPQQAPLPQELSGGKPVGPVDPKDQH